MAWAREQSGELRGGEAKHATLIDAEHTDLIWPTPPRDERVQWGPQVQPCNYKLSWSFDPRSHGPQEVDANLKSKET